jgi:hypothetical protein
MFHASDRDHFAVTLDSCPTSETETASLCLLHIQVAPTNLLLPIFPRGAWLFNKLVKERYIRCVWKHVTRCMFPASWHVCNPGLSGEISIRCFAEILRTLTQASHCHLGQRSKPSNVSGADVIRDHMLSCINGAKVQQRKSKMREKNAPGLKSFRTLRSQPHHHRPEAGRPVTGIAMALCTYVLLVISMVFSKFPRSPAHDVDLRFYLLPGPRS